jgi:hypothetical protein
MKTPKQNMTTTNVVKNIIGFAVIVIIVPPFFSAIYKMNQPSESTQYMNDAADRIQASLNSAKSVKPQPTPEAKSYSLALNQMIETYNTQNRKHIINVIKHNEAIDSINTYVHLKTPERVDLANQSKAAIDKVAVALEEVKKEIEKKMIIEGFTGSLESDQVPTVKVVDSIPAETVAPVEVEDPVTANVLNHYQSPAETQLR